IARDIVIVTEKLMDRRTGTAAAVYETFRLGRTDWRSSTTGRQGDVAAAVTGMSKGERQVSATGVCA
ncbi:hypothetical protein, partial [Massilia antarctica]|uniref:hypothetical protein n=1 Tax=Massilia antarctica TaxID=2765360 RepID=UPI0035EBFB24